MTGSFQFQILAEARLAQSVERKALNLVVVGSSPTVGVVLHQKKFTLVCSLCTPLYYTTPDAGMVLFEVTPVEFITKSQTHKTAVIRSNSADCEEATLSKL